MNYSKLSLNHTRSTVAGCLLSATAWALLAASPASAAFITTSDTSATFLAGVKTYYLEDFNNYSSGDYGPSMSFSKNGFSYDVTATPSDHVYTTDPSPTDPTLRAISTAFAYSTLVFTFGNGVDAVGGAFFLTAADGTSVAGSLTVDLFDPLSQELTEQTFTVPSATGFEGFIAHGASIRSLTVNPGPDPGDPNTPGVYATVDNLYAGTAKTPEPASMALLFSGLCACAFRAYRKRTA